MSVCRNDVYIVCGECEVATDAKAYATSWIMAINACECSYATVKLLAYLLDIKWYSTCVCKKNHVPQIIICCKLCTSIIIKRKKVYVVPDFGGICVHNCFLYFRCASALMVQFEKCFGEFGPFFNKYPIVRIVHFQVLMPCRLVLQHIWMAKSKKTVIVLVRRKN